VDELEKIGHAEIVEFGNLHDGGHFHIHRACAIWSYGVLRDSSGMLSNVGLIVRSSLPRKCAFCSHFGASLACKMACPKFFHYPCVAAAQGFQIMQSYISFCREHLGVRLFSQ
jgi:[histone H3]-lysine4 N-trimethyltransferase MLL3